MNKNKSWTAKNKKKGSTYKRDRIVSTVTSRNATVSLTQERQEAFTACLAHFACGQESPGDCDFFGVMVAMVQTVQLALLYMLTV